MEPIPPQPPPKPVHLTEPPQTGERRVVVQKDVTTPYLMISYHVPETKNPDYYALDVLNSVLSAGNSSRLYSALVDQKQLATNVFTWMPLSFDPFEFNVYVECNEGVKEADAENAVYEEIDKIKKWDHGNRTTES